MYNTELSLIIMSPEQVVEQCQVSRVNLPGKKSRFEVLKGHAPLISALENGVVEYVTSGGDYKKLSIKSGFVEILNNKVSVCVEL